MVQKNTTMIMEMTSIQRRKDIAIVITMRLIPIFMTTWSVIQRRATETLEMYSRKRSLPKSSRGQPSTYDSLVPEKMGLRQEIALRH
jgi:hypothetical protein